MKARSNRGGFLLINMMGPVLAFAILIATVVWLVGTNWDAFPVWAQTGLKGAGLLLVLALIVGNVMVSRGPNGGRRGF